MAPGGLRRASTRRKSIAETEAVMGLASAKSIAWEAEAGAPVGITLA